MLFVQLRIAPTASPQEYEHWRKTIISRLSGMAYIAPIFAYYSPVDVRKQLERQYQRALDFGEEPLKREHDGGSYAGVDREELPRSHRPVVSTDDHTDLSTVRSTALGNDSGVENLVGRMRVDSTSDLEESAIYQDQDEAEGGVPSPQGTPNVPRSATNQPTAGTTEREAAQRRLREKFDQILNESLQSEDFINEVVAQMLTQLPNAIQAHWLARIHTIHTFFDAHEPVVAKDITKQIKERIGVDKYQVMVSKADLAGILKELRSVMLLGRHANMHPTVVHSLCLGNFMRSTIWHKDKTSLAKFLDHIDTAHEVFKMQTLTSGYRHEAVLNDQYLCSTLIISLQADTRLHSFYEPWAYKGQPYPTGGFGEMKCMLIKWLQSRKLDEQYGFGRKRSSREDPPSPAVTAVATDRNNNYFNQSRSVQRGAAAGGRHSGGSGGPDKSSSSSAHRPDSTEVYLCKWCNYQGHTIKQCRKYIAAGSPSEIPRDRLDTYSRTMKELKGGNAGHHDKPRATGATTSSYGHRDTAAKPKKAHVKEAQAHATNASDGLFFLEFPHSVNTITVAQASHSPVTKIYDRHGVAHPFHDLIMFDNGANINLYLNGAALPLTRTVKLDPSKTIKAATANGHANYDTMSFCPLVGDFFVHSDTPVLQTCILSEGRCVEKRWRVEHQPTSENHPTSDWTKVHINGHVLHFDRFSNNLFYMTLADFTAALTPTAGARPSGSVCRHSRHPSRTQGGNFDHQR
jgi:hypothetical protein